MPIQHAKQASHTMSRAFVGLSLAVLSPLALASGLGELGFGNLLSAIWAIVGILGSLAALAAGFLFYRMGQPKALFILFAILIIPGVLSRTLIFLFQYSPEGLSSLPMVALNVLSGLVTLVEWAALVVAAVMTTQANKRTESGSGS